MPKLVIVTFDLSGAKSPQYKIIRDGMADLGLYKYIVKDDHKVYLPYNTVAGKPKAGSPTGLRDRLAKSIKALFRTHRLKGRAFIAVGGRWAWAKRVT